MKMLITLQGEEVAPRFDLCSEVLIVKSGGAGGAAEPRTVLLPSPSSDELCSLIIKEEIALVICGGIEETHFQYLEWKKVKVIDRVIGAHPAVRRLLEAGQLLPGTIVKNGGMTDAI